MDEEKKTVPTEEQGESTEAETKQKTEEELAEEARRKLEERMYKLAAGTLKLEKPIRAQSTDITELRYDFTKITGTEYVNALDSDPAALARGQLSARQSLALFAAAVAKCMKKVDATDVRERIGIRDCIKAVQLATVFFNTSSRAGERRIINE